MLPAAFPARWSGTTSAEVDTEGHEVVHFDFRKAAGLVAVPVLGGTLAVGAAALPAHAQTWNDTSLQAYSLTQPSSSTTSGAVVSGVASGSGQGSTLTYNAPSG
jgi:hypothetical protein